MRLLSTIVMLGMIAGGVGVARAADTAATTQNQSTVVPDTTKTGTTTKSAAKPMHPRNKKTAKPASHVEKPKKKKSTKPKATPPSHPADASAPAVTGTTH